MKKEEKSEKILFKVKATTNVKRLSEAIYRTYLEGTDIEIQSIGPNAVNQSVKATIEAKAKLSKCGINILINPFFREIEFDEKKKSAVVLAITKIN